MFLFRGTMQMSASAYDWGCGDPGLDIDPREGFKAGAIGAIGDADAGEMPLELELGPNPCPRDGHPHLAQFAPGHGMRKREAFAAAREVARDAEGMERAGKMRAAEMGWPGGRVL